MKSYILAANNTALKVTNLFGSGILSGTDTIEGLPVGTIGNSATGELIVKVSVRENLGGSPTGTADVNVESVGGNNVDTGAGNVEAGTQRVVLASDQPAVAIKPDKASAANVPAIAGTGDVLAANANRKAWAIQNCGTNALFVRFATGATTSIFHRVLKGGSANDDGLGGVIEDNVYTGIVSVAGTTPRLVVTEL